MVKLSTHISRLLCTGFWVVMASSAGAQSAASYPHKPVRIIVPYAPGGGTTPVATIYAEWFNRELGQAFITDYRPGGGTMVGTTVAARATPDGYTLLVATSALLVNHWLYPGRQYDTLKDFTPISGLQRSESVFLVNPSVAVNLKEFIAHAKASPGKLNVASSSALNVLHYQRIMNATGTRFTIVNYKGGGQVMPDLIAGNVQGFINTVGSAQSFVRAGKLKGLAISGDKRNSAVPDVPTFSEAGLKDLDIGNWLALFAPGKTPKDIVEKLNAQARKAQAAPEVISALEKLGLVPNPMTVAQAENFIRTETGRLGELIKESGLKPGDD